MCVIITWRKNYYSLARSVTSWSPRRDAWKKWPAYIENRGRLKCLRRKPLRRLDDFWCHAVAVVRV